MILAETVPTPAQFNSFWVVAGFLVLFGSNLVAIIAFFRRDRKREVGPQPFRIEFEEKFAKVEDFHRAMERNEREHENIFRKMGGMERGLGEKLDLKFAEMQKGAVEGREKLHNRLNDMVKALSNLEGRFQSRWDK